MRQLKRDVRTLIERGRDSHLRLAVTGLSRSGKTAFITALVNQLINVNNGSRLQLFSAVRDHRIHGVKRIPQRDLNIPRFAYDEAIATLCGKPAQWPSSTRGISELRLAIRFNPDSTLSRLINRSTLYLDIFDYPGEWLLDLPMLEKNYFSWSAQMTNIIQDSQRNDLAAPWLALCQQCDPLAPVDEQQLATISKAYTHYLLCCKKQGQYYIQPGRFILPGELEDAPVLQFFPWPFNENDKLIHADPNSNIGMLKKRYDYYCQKIVKGFYKDHFTGFDRQIVLVDCLQPLNNGPNAFNDMRLALGQLIQSFHYGKRTLLRRLFSPHIDKIMFAATKADHVTPDQHRNLVSLLQQLVFEARQFAAFEGISIDCVALASVQATEFGVIEQNGKRIPTLKGNKLEDGKPLLVYPGSVPSKLPAPSFWQQQRFHFDEFQPLSMDIDRPLPHIRLDAVMEFLLGDKLL